MNSTLSCCNMNTILYISLIVCVVGKLELLCYIIFMVNLFSGKFELIFIVITLETNIDKHVTKYI